MKNYMNLFYKLFVLIFVVSISSCSNEDSAEFDEKDADLNKCDCSELQLDESYNHFFLEDRTKGYTGMCEELNKKGIVVLVKNFEKGKVQGEVIKYYSSGSVKSILHYDKNLQHGFQYELSENGDTLIKASFNRGVQDSIYYKK